jgi:hypothetical protein
MQRTICPAVQFEWVGTALLAVWCLNAAVNYAFIERFQDMARGHVIVRRLERAYGKEVVRREYERLAQDS